MPYRNSEILPDQLVLAILRAENPDLDPTDEAAIKAARRKTRELRRKLSAQIFNSGSSHIGLDARGAYLGLVVDTDSQELAAEFGHRLAQIVTLSGRKGSREPVRQATYGNQPSIEGARLTRGRAKGMVHRPGRSGFSSGNSGYATNNFRPKDDPFDQIKVAASCVVVDTSCVMAGLMERDVYADGVIRLGEKGKVDHCGTSQLRRELMFVSERIPTPAEQIRALHWKRTMRIVPTPTQPIPLELVGGDKGDLAPLQSALAAGVGLITLDTRHLLGNAPAIKEKLGIDVFSPKKWLETMAPAILDILKLE